MTYLRALVGNAAAEIHSEDAIYTVKTFLPMREECRSHWVIEVLMDVERDHESTL